MHAQTTPTPTQAPGPSVDFVSRFTEIRAVRELSDGRVLVADRRERRLYVVGPGDHEPRVLGREGSGPGEYRALNRLVPLGGDSTLMTDGTLLRWTLLTGATLQSRSPWARDVVTRDRIGILAVDHSGRMYWTENLISVSQRSTTERIAGADSAVLLRMALTGGRIDTLVRLRSKFGPISRVNRVVNGIETQYVLNDPLRVADQVAVCTDGWVAVANPVTARVDWISPERATVRGVPLEGRAAPVTEIIKRDAIERFVSPRLAKYFTPNDFPSFSAQVPAFVEGGTLCLPDGRALVTRYDLRSKPVRLQVVSRKGTVDRTIELPAGSRAVGTGLRALFIATPDDDDLMILRRYRWP